MPTLRSVTLGCRVNQYETQFVREALRTIGWRDAEDGESAAMCLVNTCTVTHEGDAKSRQAIRRLARQNPGARLVVMGCYATRCPDEVAKLPGVTEVLTDKRELPDWLTRFGVIDVPTGIAGFESRRRAYVKVQDGCVLNCSFCIIPRVRPGLSSRPPDHILDEVGRLIDAGHREVVLTGIHLGHYGVDLNRGRPKSDWTRLADLVAAIARLPGEFRVRLSSIEATEVTRELLAAMAEAGEKVCSHLHISMQSGSERTLRAMRRRWGAQRFADRCRLAQATLDRPALTTDVIVGFPGESEEDFGDTCRLADEIGFSKLHIFPYSARAGTDAAGYPDQISAEIKNERVDRLKALEATLRRRFFEGLVGQNLQVLLESTSPRDAAWMLGTSCRYAPVELKASLSARGQFSRARVTGVTDDWLVAEG